MVMDCKTVSKKFFKNQIFYSITKAKLALRSLSWIKYIDIYINIYHLCCCLIVDICAHV